MLRLNLVRLKNISCCEISPRFFFHSSLSLSCVFLTKRKILINRSNRSLEGPRGDIFRQRISGRERYSREAKKIEEREREREKRGKQEEEEALKLLDLHSRKPRRRDKAIGTRSPRTVYQRRSKTARLGSRFRSLGRGTGGLRLFQPRKERAIRERINDTCTASVISTNGAINLTIFYL